MFCWELGHGNGHVGPFLPIAHRLVEEGHRVVMVLRDTARLRKFYVRPEIEVLQSPFKVRQAVPRIARPRTFAEMLLNLGYRDAEELWYYVRAWRQLIRYVSPDVILADHAPTALVAARGMGIFTGTIGHGFYVPRTEYPITSLAPWIEIGLADCKEIDDRVSANCNNVLRRLSSPELCSLSSLFSEVNEVFFTTFSELDHFGPRDVRYLGPLNGSLLENRQPTVWPNGGGVRVLAYLKDVPWIDQFIEAMHARDVSAIVVWDGSNTIKIPDSLRRKIVVPESLVPLSKYIDETSLLVSNAGHATICEFLRAGVGQLLIPLTLEQAILSRKVEAMGAGVAVQRDSFANVLHCFDWILQNLDSMGGASFISRKYGKCSNDDIVAKIIGALPID
jgi:UDP:flavonoid glycosyltransferase YjiC (YdhE family)